MVNDMLGGRIDVAFDNTPNVLPQVNAGSLPPELVQKLNAELRTTKSPPG
jgi:tripartite-type tricarboxylate transporter receptor subunit TctC